MGFVRGGSNWTVDFPGTRQLTGAGRTFTFGLPGDIPLAGDWNGSGTSKAGVYRDGSFILDYDGNGQSTGQYTVYSFTPPQRGDVPVVGKWRGMTSCVGIYRGGQWLLDWDCKGVFEAASDKVYNFLAPEPDDVPVVGAWTFATSIPGGGDFFVERIGIYRKGVWLLDANGNGTFDGADAGDMVFRFDRSSAAPLLRGRSHDLGAAATGGVPVVGDWNGDGRSKPGIYRDGTWVLDTNGSHAFGLFTFQYGMPGDVPVIGHW